MAVISGVVEDESGNAIEGADVIIIRESDNAVIDVISSGSDGAFSKTGLDETEKYHAAASYNDGSTDYAGRSLPFIEPFVTTGPIDDFEDNDISEYSGDTLSFDVQSGTVQEGSFALEMGNDNGSFNSIQSQSGLPRYPQTGDAFKFRFYAESGAIGEMLFGVQDSDNRYEARISEDSGGISLNLRENGSVTSLDSQPASIPANEWLEGVIDWGETTKDEPITFTVNDASGNQIAQVSDIDGTFTSGGIGWRAAIVSFSGNSAYFDIAQLTTAGGSSVTSDVIDDFEDADIAEYTGDTGAYRVQSATAFEGTYALEDDTTDDSDKDLISTSGLDKYPSAGDVFQWRYRTEEDSNAFNSQGRFIFGVQSSNLDSPKYIAAIHESADSMYLEKRETDGSLTTLASAGVVIPTSSWMRVEIDWGTSGDITMTLFDSSGTQLQQITGNDSEYTSGGVGFSQTHDGNDRVKQWDLAEVIDSSQADDGDGGASPGTVIDDFEDGGIGEYAGDTGSYHVQSGESFSGTYGLEDNTTSDSGQTIGSTSGLNYYPSAGDSFEYRYKPTGDTGGFNIQARLLFAVGDASNALNNCYFINIGTMNGDFTLAVRDGGNETSLGSTSISIPSGEWMRVQVDWASDGTLTATVEDASGTQLGSVSGSDATFTSGGIGMYFSHDGNQGVHHWDEIVTV